MKVIALPCAWAISFIAFFITTWRSAMIEGLGVADVELLLARAPLALRILDRDARGLQQVAHRAHHRLFLGGLEDVVVLDVVAGRLEVAKTLLVDRPVVLVEEIELELRGHVGGEPELLEPRELRLEDGARRMRDRLVVMVVDEIGEAERRALEPGALHQRRHVGLHDEVAVALGPVGGRVAGHRLHIDVVGEQVVAAVRLLPRAVDEELRVEALADQPPLHVGEGDNDGVDLALLDVGFQRVERIGHGELLTNEEGRGQSPRPR